MQAVFFSSKPYAFNTASDTIHRWKLPSIIAWPRTSEIIERYLKLPLILVSEEEALATDAASRLQGMLMLVCLEGLEFFKEKHPRVKINLFDVFFLDAWQITSKHFKETAKRLSGTGVRLLESLNNVKRLMRMLEHYDAVSFFEEFKSIIQEEQQTELSLWHHTAISVDNFYEVLSP